MASLILRRWQSASDYPLTRKFVVLVYCFWFVAQIYSVGLQRKFVAQIYCFSLLRKFVA